MQADVARGARVDRRAASLRTASPAPTTAESSTVRSMSSPSVRVMTSGQVNWKPKYFWQLRLA